MREMREIKFRGFCHDGEASGWVYGLLTGLGKLPSGFEYGYIGTAMCPRNTISEFTGLHDKNGKEIYEGDVVRIGSRSPVEVRWHDESAGFLDIGMELMSNTEVIGNRYENPDLIQNV